MTVTLGWSPALAPADALCDLGAGLSLLSLWGGARPQSPQADGMSNDTQTVLVACPNEGAHGSDRAMIFISN